MSTQNTLNYLALILFLPIFVLSCTEEEIIPTDKINPNRIVEPTTNIESAADLIHPKWSNRIIVHPSGDMTGITDAAAIEDALNLVGPHGVVQLDAGDFFLNRPVSAPEGFSGMLRGKGKEATAIFGVGSEAEPFPLTTILDGLPLTEQDRAVLFHFPSPGGRLVVERLAVSLKSGFFTETIETGFFGPNDLFAFFVVDIGDEEVNTTFRDLLLQGIEANDNGPFLSFLQFQPGQGIVVSGSSENFPEPVSGGRHSVSKSMFDQLGLQAINLQLFDRANIQIRNNTLTDIKQVITRLVTGSVIDISRNNIENESLGGIVVTQEGFPVGEDKNLVFIKNNRVKTDGFMSIEIGAAPNFKSLIANNHITVGPDPNDILGNLTGIGLFPGQEKALLINNTIRGTSESAIAFFGVSKSLAVSNDVSGHNSTEANYLLDPDTFKNLIINRGNSTFIDDGIDNRVINLPVGFEANPTLDIQKMMKEHMSTYSF